MFDIPEDIHVNAVNALMETSWAWAEPRNYTRDVGMIEKAILAEREANQRVIISLRSALEEIKALDYGRAAVNMAAHTAHLIATGALISQGFTEGAPSSGWREIATAKANETVLVIAYDRVWQAILFDDGEWRALEYEGAFILNRDGGVVPLNPSHWMPLPSPPSHLCTGEA